MNKKNLRCDVSLQDRDGNTAAHLAVIGSQSIGTENRYNNDLEAVFDPVHIDRLTQMEIPSGKFLCDIKFSAAL